MVVLVRDEKTKGRNIFEVCCFTFVIYSDRASFRVVSNKAQCNNDPITQKEIRHVYNQFRWFHWTCPQLIDDLHPPAYNPTEDLFIRYSMT